MPILIDGYNLLNMTGIVGRGAGPGGLERSRVALLNFLAASIEPAEVPRTTVVFDAQAAPPGLPRTVKHHGITVRFAANYESADDLLEELIRADSSPRRLVVVSSDHRIQRAAKRRRATAVDSDVWYAELIRARRERFEASGGQPARPAVPLLEEDVSYWLRQFGGESALTEFLRRELREASPAAEPKEAGEPDAKSPTADDEASHEPVPGELPDLANPFPPGYGEDLLEGEADV